MTYNQIALAMTGLVAFAQPALADNLSCNSPATAINQIQGDSQTSPLQNQSVTVEAVVTADFQSGLNGFYIQSSQQDENPQTSEGLFVYTGNKSLAVSAGDKVRLTATVSEHNNQTQLGDITGFKVCSANNPMPKTVRLTLPFTAADAPEALEGMLVSFDNLTVNDTYNLPRFGTVLLGQGRRMIPTQIAKPGPEAQKIMAQNSLNKILLDDASSLKNPSQIPYPGTGLTAKNTLRIGDTASMPLGILSQSPREYLIQPISKVDFQQTNSRTPKPYLAKQGNINIASFNVLNFFKKLGERGADTEIEQQRQSAKIVSAINALNADVVGLMEIQNNGFDDNSAIALLVNSLNQAAPQANWQYIKPTTPTIGSDQIAVGLIYKASKVVPVELAKILDSSNSLRDNQGNPLFLDSKNRPTLAQKFALVGGSDPIVIAVNHFKSKGSNCDALNDPNIRDGQGNCNKTRTRAALAVGAWLKQEFYGEPTLVIGDLNAYAMEDPLQALKTAGFDNLNNKFAHHGAYSYVFRGESGQLDHALANKALWNKVKGLAEWHINADEPKAIDYNMEYKSAEQIEQLYAPDAFRSSDHDPVIISVQLTPLEKTSETNSTP